MHPSPTRALLPKWRPRRTLGLLRAVGALIALALTVPALPWVLWHATGALAPGGWDAAQHLLGRQDTGALALLAVCVIGWLAWASFVLSLLLEIPAQLRGVRTPRLPGLQMSQRAAAALVGSLLVLWPTGTALAASPTQAAPRAAVTANATAQPSPAVQAQTQTPSARQQAAVPAQGTEQATGTYTVRDTRPAESLWSIAAHLYGQGEAFTHLADANEGRTMADGRVFHADAPIHPGWVLQLPREVPRVDHTAAETHAEAQEEQQPPTQTRAQAQAQAQAGNPSDEERVVARGDTITGIALQATGDAGNWRPVYEASRGAQPEGLPCITDADVIVPDQRITIPAELQKEPAAPKQHDDAPGPAPDSSGAGNEPGASRNATPPNSPAQEQQEQKEDPAGSGARTDDATQRPRATPSAAPRPSLAGQAPERPPVSARPSAPAPEPPAPAGQAAPSAAAQHAEQGPASAPTGSQTALQVFGLLAGVVTASLLARRLWQWRTRRPGQRMPEGEPQPVEDVLEEVAHDGAQGVNRLRAALRLLAQNTDTAVPPDLRAARITADSIQVLPDDITAPIQPPFTSVRATWWTLPHTMELPDIDETEAGDPPYASMVTLGATSTGELLLVNLAAWQVLLVDGAHEERAQVMAAMATELAIGPYADYVEVMTCGMGSMAADLRTLGVHYLADPCIAAREFTERVLDAHQNPDDRGFPYVVLCAAEVEEDVLWQLAQSLERAHQLTPCVLVLPADAATVFTDAETVDATTDTEQRVDALGADLILQRLHTASLAELARAARQAQRPADDPEGIWEHVPPEPTPVPGPTQRLLANAPAPQDTHATDDTALPAHTPDTSPSAASHPVMFQALLAASGDPGQTQVRPVPVDDAAQEETGQQIGPKFRIPVLHALTAGARVPPVPETSDHRTVNDAVPHNAAPRLHVLGTPQMNHLPAGPMSPRLTELAAHLILKPDSSPDRLCEDLGDAEPWSPRTLSTRLRDLRTALGKTPDGTSYVPHRPGKTAPYAVSDAVQCDWTDFQRLSALGLSRGPEGLPYLERALALVDGIPLGTHPASWMTGVRTRMQADITNVAHTVATYRTQDGPHQDLPSARTACRTGLTVDSYCEWLHRALMRTEAAAGNHTGLRAAITIWHEMTSSLPPGQIDRTTKALVDELLNAS
ncbi:hypothetical protein OKJ48_02735 [Streptomyces kunmingensis]|uniref:Bacterial transcriptional activator domain-containing protein n=1 Tax=Streptomyces kunmingensis TaxID=68225 RepID=A0ABU6C375_9ACTN|nr:hypothetical protein [Streptomyces kunmingensis]MEB3959178.1 hypothetical protein [Streptomyces kunmingensis]